MVLMTKEVWGGGGVKHSDDNWAGGGEEEKNTNMR